MTTVWVTTRFIALHYWKDAPDKVNYLRNVHRHEFHVKLELTVHHDDRDVELIQLKDWLDKLLVPWTPNVDEEDLPNDLRVWILSCEQFASAIINFVRLDEVYKNYFPVTCSVSEDGEGGATVHEDQ